MTAFFTKTQVQFGRSVTKKKSHCSGFVPIKKSLLERKDGAYLWLTFPYNSGNSLNANHSLTIDYTSANRIALTRKHPDSFEDIPDPES